MNYDVLQSFLKRYGDLFVSIRSNPKEKYYSEILKVYKKYVKINIDEQDLQFIKSEINDIKDLDNNIKKRFSYIRLISIDGSFKNIDKVNLYCIGLIKFSEEMINLMETDNDRRIHDLADAAHNYPEFLMHDLWSAENYYDIYIKPYNKKWKDNILDNMEKKNLYKRLISRFMKNGNR